MAATRFGRTVSFGISFLVLFFASAALGASRTVYVSAEGDDAASGLTRDQPLKTVQAAVTLAKSVLEEADLVTVCVAPGVYTWENPVVVDAAIHLEGETGRAEDVVFRNTGKASWNSPDHRVFKLDHADARIAGAVVENGSLYGTGSGILIQGEGGSVSNCVVRGHEGSSYNANMPGGAVFLDSDHALLTHSVVSNCYVSGCDADWIAKDSNRSAGGVGVNRGRVENCLVLNCGAIGSNTITPSIDGGIIARGGRVVNCTVIGCKGSHIGGIDALKEARVENCACYDNVRLTAVREFLQNEDGSITTNRFADAVTVLPWGGSGACFANCAGDAEVLAGSARCRSGMTAADFRDYDNGVYVPSLKSLLMNGGATPEGWGAFKDLAGEPRVKGKAIDIGCFEGNPPGLALRIR